MSGVPTLIYAGPHAFLLDAAGDLVPDPRADLFEEARRCAFVAHLQAALCDGDRRRGDAVLGEVADRVEVGVAP